MIRTVVTFITGCNQCPYLASLPCYGKFEDKCTLFALQNKSYSYIEEQKVLDYWFTEKCRLEETI